MLQEAPNKNFGWSANSYCRPCWKHCINHFDWQHWFRSSNYSYRRAREPADSVEIAFTVAGSGIDIIGNTSDYDSQAYRCGIFGSRNGGCVIRIIRQNNRNSDKSDTDHERLGKFPPWQYPISLCSLIHLYRQSKSRFCHKPFNQYSNCHCRCFLSGNTQSNRQANTLF